jgi:hypothetical protein
MTHFYVSVPCGMTHFYGNVPCEMTRIIRKLPHLNGGFFLVQQGNMVERIVDKKCFSYDFIFLYASIVPYTGVGAVVSVVAQHKV